MLNPFKKVPVPKKEPDHCILPISRVKTAVVFLDTVDTSWMEARKQILAFFFQHKIIADFYFIDTNTYKKGLGPTTNPEQTLYGKDFNLSERLRTEKINALFSKTPDMVISLVNREHPGTEAILKACNSTYKIGRRAYKKDSFSLIISDPEGKSFNQYEAWETISKYLKAII